LAGKIPPAFSSLFGAERLFIVLPAQPEEEREGYRKLALALSSTGPEETRIVTDQEVDELPRGAVLLLGWHNRFLAHLADLLPPGAVILPGQGVRLRDELYPAAGHSFALATRKGEYPLGWVAGEPAALPGLGRKLPHYHRYGYLAFSGNEPVNIAKGSWEASGSPLTVFLGPARPELQLPPGKNLLKAIPGR